MIEVRPKRITSPDHAPPMQATADLGEMVTGPVWLEPLAGLDLHEDPATTLQRREHEMPDTSVASVNNALQRAEDDEAAHVGG